MRDPFRAPTTRSVNPLIALWLILVATLVAVFGGARLLACGGL